MGRRILILIVLLGLAAAWSGDTHRMIAEEIGEHINCGQEIVDASTVPDLVFHDTVRHHYYDTSWDCPVGDWICPEEDDFIAMELAEEWVVKGDCYSIGIATHYFFDSKVFWHKVQKENSNRHSYWEKKVGEAYGPGFEYCKYGICTNWGEFELWKAEFRTMLPDPPECLADVECEHSCVKGECVELSLWDLIWEWLSILVL